MYIIEIVLCVEENGDRYEGSFNNGKKEGHGTFFYKGQMLKGFWVNDVARCGEMTDVKYDAIAAPYPIPVVRFRYFIEHTFKIIC